MTKHIKPTKEELESKNQEILDGLAELEDKKEELEPLPEEESNAEEEVVEGEEETEEPEVKEIFSDDDEEEEQTYKKRYSESTREAQILHAKNKKMLDAFNQVSEVVDPTDEEMQKEFEDWEDLNDFEKKMAKENWKTSKRFEAINTIAQDNKDGDAWNEKVDKFIDDPATVTNNPSLEGRLDEFKLFVEKPTRRGVDFQDLISAFLYEIKTQKPGKRKGKMFETGTGGPDKKTKVKSDKMSIETAAALKKSNYNAYKEALMAGKIEQEF